MLYKEKYRSEPARLAGWDYRTPAWYFVTICVASQRHMLGEIEDGVLELTAASGIAGAHLASLSTYYSGVSLDRFGVMPNHVHVLVQIDGPAMAIPTLAASLTQEFSPPKAGSLSAMIRSYKAGVSRAWHEAGLTDFCWQPRFHEHIVRSQASLEATRVYIEENPKNWEEDPDR